VGVRAVLVHTDLRDPAGSHQRSGGAHDAARCARGVQVTEGDIDVLATDHAPWTREQKLDPALSITRLRPGVSNLQFMLPMYFSRGVGTGRITPERFVETLRAVLVAGEADREQDGIPAEDGVHGRREDEQPGPGR